MSIHTNKDSAGFTIIELVVVIGIFTFVSIMALANYPGFSHKISIQNLTHQIALEVRQAQVFGLSVQEATAGSGAFPGYGVYFTRTNLEAFVLYTDLDNDKKYDGDFNCSISPECLEKISIASGDMFRNICAIRSNGVRDCAFPSGSDGFLDYLNISFVRPDPDANILGTLSSVDTLYQKAEVSVEPPKKDFFKTVVVWSTGQISVE